MKRWMLMMAVMHQVAGYAQLSIGNPKEKFSLSATVDGVADSDYTWDTLPRKALYDLISERVVFFCQLAGYKGTVAGTGYRCKYPLLWQGERHQSSTHLYETACRCEALRPAEAELQHQKKLVISCASTQKRTQWCLPPLRLTENNAYLCTINRN